MDDSILNSIKGALGLQEDYDAFDFELIMHINSALANLTQLGVGPKTGFRIENDSTVWSDLLGDDAKLDNAKALVYYKTKIAFDPPNTPHLLNAYEEQIREQEWRLTVSYDEQKLQQELILDGGTP